MAYIFTIPMFFSIYYLLKGRQDLVFLNVYLPCQILLPDYYAVRIPHLPPESAASWALLPLGISLLLYPTWKMDLRRMDLWVVLYMLSQLASETMREVSAKDGIAFFASNITQVYLAYVIGRRLIEPDLRVKTLQRIVILFLCLTPCIAWEYRMTENPWVRFGSQVLHLDIVNFVQIRGGSARVQASFGHAILAGIMFFIVFMLNCQLSLIYKRDKGRLSNLIARLEQYHAPAIMMVLFLWCTRSRGPMASAVASYSILQIARFRYRKLATVVLLVVLGVGGGLVYTFLQNYTNSNNTNDGSLSEAQTSAMYRRELLKNYVPLAEQGGWLGWGALSVPHVAGQTSIDNGYLLIELAQGKLGLYLFFLIMADALITTAYRAYSFHSVESRYLAFILLGSMIGLFTSLTTVYLGGPVSPMYFLLLGWSQSLKDEVGADPKFQFKRVFA
jgi:hypothetical protein